MSVKSEQIEVSPSDFEQMKEFVYEKLISTTKHDADGNRMRWYPWHSADYRFIHTLNVVSISTKIARKEGANTDSVRISALFHDIAKFSSPQKNHAQDGADLARNYLQNNFDYSDSFLNDIHRIISNHTYEGNLSDLLPEDRCLIEADMIDKIGANGSALLILRMGYDSRPSSHISDTLQKVITRGKETLSRVTSEAAYSIAYQRVQRATWLKEWIDEETPGTSELPTK